VNKHCSAPLTSADVDDVNLLRTFPVVTVRQPDRRTKKGQQSRSDRSLT
jgi:hypothetical protein